VSRRRRKKKKKKEEEEEVTSNSFTIYVLERNTPHPCFMRNLGRRHTSSLWPTAARSIHVPSRCPVMLTDRFEPLAVWLRSVKRKLL
jgi:hypothetical protein